MRDDSGTVLRREVALTLPRGGGGLARRETPSGPLRWALRAGVLIAGGLPAFVSRNSMSPDGVSYVDLSDAWLAGDWSRIVNGYWSPAYSALIAGARALFHPGPAKEATVVHLVNFVVFVVCIVCFEYFLAALRRFDVPTAGPGSDDFRRPEPWPVTLFIYAVFGWSAFGMLNTGLTSPDTIVAALTYLVAAMLLETFRSPTRGRFIAIGVALGAAYLSKAAMFPVGVIFAACTAIGWGIRAPLRRRLLTPAAFLLVSFPLLGALSSRSGHFTFGEAGKFAYGWFVNNYPVPWTGAPKGSGTPRHPPVVLNLEPIAYGYPGDIGETYPAWTDPSYWNAGMVPRVELRRQLREVAIVSREYAKVLGVTALTIVLLAALAKDKGAVIRRMRRVAVLVAPLIFLFVLYSQVWAEPRFYAAAAVILILLSFDALYRAAEPGEMRRLALGAALMMLWNIGRIAPHLAHYARLAVDDLRGRPVGHPEWVIAQEVTAQGVYPGDRVAVIGSAFDSYWARLAGLRIIAEIPQWQAPRYWAATDSTKRELDNRFASMGARLILANQLPSSFREPEWQRSSIAGYAMKKISR
jgi:hypothetical protein